MVFKNIALKLAQNGKMVLYHFLVWMLFISYEMSYIYLIGHTMSGFADYFWAYVSNIVLFYVNLWCLDFCFTRKGRGYWYMPLLLLQYVVYCYSHFLTAQLMNNWVLPNKFLWSKPFLLQSMYRSVYFLGFSVGYWFVLQTLRSTDMINKMQSRHLIQQKRSAELERNLFKAKNAYLTSQINPHLLFNTLNFIYSSLYEVSKKSAEIVVLLSDMMRYSLTEIGEDGQVELYKEIEHIENMVQLNQARFNDKLNIKLYLSGEFDVRIIPLVFLTFIENIFKHGDLSNAEYPGIINISFHNNILDFYTSNKIRKVNINKGHGIGIENSITRLQMAYGDKFKLKCGLDNEQYITNLVIDFN